MQLVHTFLGMIPPYFTVHSVKYNWSAQFWADHKAVLPIHYAVYLPEVGCKKCAAALRFGAKVISIDKFWKHFYMNTLVKFVRILQLKD